MNNPKYYFLEGNEQLKKFSTSELEKFQNAYEGTEYSNLAQLKKGFPDFPTTGIFQMLPYRLTNEKCVNCGGDVYHKFRRQNNKREECKICIDCQHTFVYGCDCEECRLKKTSEFKEVWDNYLKVNYPDNIPFENLTYYDEIQMFKVLNLYFDPVLNCFIFPNSRNQYSFHYKINEFSDYNWEVLHSLVQKKILKPAVGNNFGYENYPPYDDTYNLSKYKWILNLSKDGECFEVKDYIEFSIFRKFSPEIKLEIFKEIYRSEVRNYTNFYSQKFLKFMIDEFIVDLVIECFFAHYSLSKVFNTIYYALNASLRFQSSYKVSSKAVMGHFRNKIVEYSHNLRDPKTIKDFNRLTDDNIGDFNDYAAKYIGLPYNWFYLDSKFLFPELVRSDEKIETITSEQSSE